MTQNGNPTNHYRPVFTKVIHQCDSRSGGTSDTSGFTLVELIVVMVVIGILAVMSIPSFTTYVNKTKNGRVLSEIRTLSTEISVYTLERGTNPPDLVAINRGGFLDPWKRVYMYTNIAGGGTPLMDPLNVFSLNTDYDLYSMGVNGRSSTAGGDPDNDDDIVRSNDGSYVGPR